MKTNAIHLSLALLAVTGASAQPDESPEERRPPHVPPLVALLDANHDGTLSAGEIQNASTSLATLDSNSDGAVTRDEIRPPRPEGDAPPDGEGPAPKGGRPPGERPAPPIIAALDTDKDGSLSAAELKAAPESLKTLDKNNDGELSRQELQPRGHRPPKNGGSRNGHRPDGPPPEYGTPTGIK